MFDLQTIIVVFLVAVALAYAGFSVWKKSYAFSRSGGCAADCGCGDAAKPNKRNMDRIGGGELL
jgi:hypothetical protein